ncbi:hypothetical protein U0070_009497 [Myodes glareolus]|uniref:Uncharacterized protein n=1 Tax=Myodes glareolus TaxID=447135 RepID=A0AAW0I963_MYOGA
MSLMVKITAEMCLAPELMAVMLQLMTGTVGTSWVSSSINRKEQKSTGGSLRWAAADSLTPDLVFPSPRLLLHPLEKPRGKLAGNPSLKMTVITVPLSPVAFSVGPHLSRCCKEHHFGLLMITVREQTRSLVPNLLPVICTRQDSPELDSLACSFNVIIIIIQGTIEALMRPSQGPNSCICDKCSDDTSVGSEEQDLQSSSLSSVPQGAVQALAHGFSDTISGKNFGFSKRTMASEDRKVFRGCDELVARKGPGHGSGLADMTTEVKCTKGSQFYPLLSQDVIFSSTKAASLAVIKITRQQLYQLLLQCLLCFAMFPARTIRTQHLELFGAYSNCHQKGFFNQLMETDADPQSDIRVLLRREEVKEKGVYPSQRPKSSQGFLPCGNSKILPPPSRSRKRKKHGHEVLHRLAQLPMYLFLNTMFTHFTVVFNYTIKEFLKNSQHGRKKAEIQSLTPSAHITLYFSSSVGSSSQKTTVCLLSDHFYKMPINNKQASQVGPQFPSSISSLTHNLDGSTIQEYTADIHHEVTQQQHSKVRKPSVKSFVVTSKMANDKEPPWCIYHSASGAQGAVV